MRVSYLISSLLTGILNLNWIYLLTSLLWWEMPGLNTFFFEYLKGFIFLRLALHSHPTTLQFHPQIKRCHVDRWASLCPSSVSRVKQSRVERHPTRREIRNKKTACDLRGTVNDRWCWLLPGSATLIPDLPTLACWLGINLCLFPRRTPGNCFGSEWSVDQQPTATCLHRTADRCPTRQLTGTRPPGDKTPPHLRQHLDSTHSRCYCILLKLGQAAVVCVPLLEHKATFV